MNEIVQSVALKYLTWDGTWGEASVPWHVASESALRA